MIDHGISREARVHVGGGQYRAPVGDVSVSVDAAPLERAERLLADVSGGVEKALRGAMRKAVTRLNRSSVKAVQERYAISTRSIREEEKAHVSYSYGQGTQAHILFRGKRIPLFRFDGAAPKTPRKDMSRRVPVMHGSRNGGLEGIWHLMHPGLPASGHVLKSTSPYKFEQAFVATMRTGHTGIYERTGILTAHDKDEIEELFGPALPQMLGNREVAGTLAEEAMQGFEADLNAEVYRILNGYGG